MKKSITFCLVALTIGIFSAPAWAHKGKHKGPCHPVFEACKDAGKKGKALKACVNTFKSGGTVDGVTVPEDALKACQEKSKEKT